MRVLLVLGLALAGLLGAVTAGPGEHEKIVACYWGTWSFYRLERFMAVRFFPTTCADKI